HDVPNQDARGPVAADPRGQRATTRQGCVRGGQMIAGAATAHDGTIGRPMREKLAGFTCTLRDNGFAIGLGERRDAVAILTRPPAWRPTSLRPAFRSLFCATHSDWGRFDEIFDAYWLGANMRQALTVSVGAAEAHAPLRRRADRAGPRGAFG